MKLALPPALDAVGLPTPAVVLEAVALRDAAAALVDQLRSDPAPTLDTATAKTAAATVAAVAEHEALHPLMLRHAARLVEHAGARVTEAWETAAATLRPQLAEAFTTAAAEFATEADARPWLTPATVDHQRTNPEFIPLFRAADKLAALERMRDAYAVRTYDRGAALHSDRFEALSRCLKLSDAALVTQLPDSMRGAHTAGYWLACHQHRGVSIAWQEPAAQRANLAALSK